MIIRTKVAISVLAAGVIAVVAISSVDAREIGRTDPKRAAYYRLPWFNFDETYVDGMVIGVAIGSTKADAIRVIEGAGFKVSTSGWGDNRAGQGDLYERSDLLATMLRQPYLNFYDPDDLHRGMTIEFNGDRVAAVNVHYINSEGT